MSLTKRLVLPWNANSRFITEAAYRLTPKDELLCSGPDWTAWRGMGNLLRHAYHRIDDALIWKTAQLDVPELKQAVTEAVAFHFPELKP